MKRPTIKCLLIWMMLLCAEYAHTDDFDRVADYIRAEREGMNEKQTDMIVELFAPAIIKASTVSGLDPLIIAVVIVTESSLDPDARGSAGEVGAMQVMPRWYRRAGIDPDQATLDDQVRVGTELLANCIESCRGSILGGLTLYHMGSNGMCSHASKRARYKYRKYLKAKREAK